MPTWQTTVQDQAEIPFCRYGPGDGILDPEKHYHIAKDQFISIKEVMTAMKVLSLMGIDVCTWKKFSLRRTFVSIFKKEV